MNDGTLVASESGRQRFWLWLAFSSAVALIGFIAGLLGPGGYGGKYLRQLPISFVFTNYFSIGLGAVWIATALFGILIYRRRAFWLLVLAPIALFWPAVNEMFAHTIAACAVSNPGNAMVCFP